MLHLLLDLAIVASAQSPGDGDGTIPLAVPGEPGPPPPARLRRPAPPSEGGPRPPRPPGYFPPIRREAPLPPRSDEALAEAIRAYRDRELSARHVTRADVGVGYTFIVVDPWWGATAVSQPYAAPRTELAVLRGDQRLDAPEAFAALGDDERHHLLVEKIARKRSAAQLGFLVGVGGLVTSTVGLVQMDRARDSEQLEQWGQVTAAGLGAMTVGFIGGAIPSNRAHRLETDITASIELDELEEQIEVRNRALAKELGLSQAEVARIER